MSPLRSRIFLPLGLFLALAWTFGCGGGSSTSESGSSGGSTPVSNVQAIAVNTGPSSTLGANFNYVDGAFTSVTVCAPGSSTNCQTVGGILVDTGSFGLRILSSALTISLPQQNNGSGNPIVECGVFEDGVTWGPVQTADVKMAGEAASSVPIQVIGSANFSTIPTDCTSQGQPEQDLADLGANGILGIGQAIQDCGTDCVTSASAGVYYACPSTGCVETTESLAQQVQNPVASFASDNNGVIVELPAVSGAEATVSGSLIFGIGTQSNNGLGGATVFGTDAYGNMNTAYQGTQYLSFLDSGSNGIYFLDTSATSIPECTYYTYLYCPSTALTISVVNDAEAGTNGASGPATFTVGNADLLESNVDNAAVNGLAGPGPGMFDFGLPFFFGRNVYTAFDGRSTPAGTGPYTAY